MDDEPTYLPENLPGIHPAYWEVLEAVPDLPVSGFFVLTEEKMREFISPRLPAPNE